MIQHPNKYRRINPALIQQIIGKRGAGVLPAKADWWPMNEGAGTTFLEQIVANNAATNVSWIGSAATFNGSTQNGVTSNSQNFDFTGAQPMSISVWINPTSASSTEAIFSHEDIPLAFKGWSLLLISGLPYFAYGNGTSFTAAQSTTPVTAGVLQNIVATYDGSQLYAGLKIYINGVQVATTLVGNDGSMTPANTGLDGYIGSRPDGSISFAGRISDTRIYPSKLSQAQISTLFSAGISTIAIPAPTHFWPMNEGSGTTLFDHAGSTNLAGTGIAWTSTPAGMGAAPLIAGFNGATTFAQALAVDPTLNFNGLTPFTVSVWVYPTGSASFSLCGNLTAPTSYEGWELTSGGATGTGLLLVNNVTTNQMTALNGTTIVGSVPTLLTITYNGSLSLAGVKMYVNGAPTPVTDSSGTLSAAFTSAIPFLVGKRIDGTNFFTGVMAYMRTWALALSQAQVASLTTNGAQ